MVRESDGRAYELALSLGSNIGDREGNLDEAKKYINERLGMIALSSSRYETEAWGDVDLEVFINEMIIVRTLCQPLEALKICLDIEDQMGRRRSKAGYENRLIDIDLIFYKDFIVDRPELSLPHPRMHLRNFVLVPLNEINPQWVHPLFKKTVKELLENCKDLNITKKCH